MTKLHPTEPIATFELGIPAEQAARFFQAVGWQLAARPLMPPTIATAFRQGEELALKHLKIELRSVLHGEQKYRFHKDLAPDTNYKGETFITSHYQKSGESGSMNFYVFQTNLRDGSGEISVECLSTIIVRG